MLDVWTFHISGPPACLSLSLSFTADCLLLWPFQAHYNCAHSSNSITNRLSVTTMFRNQNPILMTATDDFGFRDAWLNQMHHIKPWTPYYFLVCEVRGWTCLCKHTVLGLTFTLLPISIHAFGIFLIMALSVCQSFCPPLAVKWIENWINTKQSRLLIIIPQSHHKTNNLYDMTAIINFSFIFFFMKFMEEWRVQACMYLFNLILLYCMNKGWCKWQIHHLVRHSSRLFYWSPPWFRMCVSKYQNINSYGLDSIVSTGQTHSLLSG